MIAISESLIRLERRVISMMLDSNGKLSQIVSSLIRCVSQTQSNGPRNL